MVAWWPHGSDNAFVVAMVPVAHVLIGALLVVGVMVNRVTAWWVRRR